MEQTIYTYNSIRTMQSPYDYNEIMQEVIAGGKKIYGPNFRVMEADRPTILKLLCWFLHDTVTAAVEEIDLEKGILLTGPVGCGKSAVMNVLRSLCKPDWQFLIMPCQRVALEFAREGYPVIDRYTIKAFCRYNRPLTVCFDDLGFESNIAYFGSNCNTMSQILPLRYDLFMEHRMITHVTTNLNSQEIETRYGNRIRSRMRQMFNVIAFPADSTDKRM